jgi:hypothetical protein
MKMKKLLDSIRDIFRSGVKPPYQRGHDYAMRELTKHGLGVKKRLQGESSGYYNMTVGEAEFDQGIRDAIRDYTALQREINKEFQQ